MNYKEINYWQGFIDNNINFDLTEESYITYFNIVNLKENTYYEEWIPFNTSEKLLQYIKYIVIPSGYGSRALSNGENNIFLYAIRYKDTEKLILENADEEKDSLLDKFKQDYESIERIGNCFSLEELKAFTKSYNKHMNFKYGVYSELKVFKNITEAGLELIKEYENDNSIEYLEEIMGETKEELEYMFNNINNNPFLLKKLIPFLNSKTFI